MSVVPLAHVVSTYTAAHRTEIAYPMPGRHDSTTEVIQHPLVEAFAAGARAEGSVAQWYTRHTESCNIC